MGYDIDLVVPWVNGADPAWLQQKKRYGHEDDKYLKSFLYRDWQLMRYWFRGVERNLPWIHRIYFVTWGHLPPWLNLKHPKLQIVRHKEYIPAEYRPTFSANPIELNLHRIPNLSEKFVYANDDTFFIGEIAEDYYFRDGLPCDCLCLHPITESCTNGFGHILWNNIACINRHFSLKECMEKNEQKWFASSYSSYVLAMNKLSYQLHNFPGFRDEHLPIPFLKSTFEEVWEKNDTLLRRACNHRFRSSEDVSAWLMRYWQLTKGSFIPRSPKGVTVSVSDSKYVLRDIFLDHQYPVVCLLESMKEMDFEERSEYIRSLFEIILPEMSSFELY